MEGSHNMRQRKYVYNTFIGFLLLSLITLALFRNQTFGFVQAIGEQALLPVQRTVYATFAPFFVSDDAHAIKKLKEENQQLIKQLVDKKKIENDNQALRDQFAMTAVSAKKLLPATIIGMRSIAGGTDQPTQLSLDKGSRDGLEKGDVVVYKDMLIGRIERVSPHMSVVTTVTSKLFVIPARTVKTGALGIAKGQDQDVFFDNVLLSEKLETQDILVTKGDIDPSGKGYPPGLIIGKLIAVHKEQSALFQSAEVRGLMNVKRLSTVFILVN